MARSQQKQGFPGRHEPSAAFFAPQAVTFLGGEWSAPGDISALPIGQGKHNSWQLMVFS
jgi:hypothetical protein